MTRKDAIQETAVVAPEEIIEMLDEKDRIIERQGERIEELIKAVDAASQKLHDLAGIHVVRLDPNK